MNSWQKPKKLEIYGSAEKGYYVRYENCGNCENYEKKSEQVKKENFTENLDLYDSDENPKYRCGNYGCNKKLKCLKYIIGVD